MTIEQMFIIKPKAIINIDKSWSICKLVFPSLRQRHPEALNVSYIYPN
ncbi:MAG: hypothetical protein MGF17_10570 [Trichodesmium sp. MAG_R04]|nr:hypothetical protein [Trichodesmium sp. MAG_R04]